MERTTNQPYNIPELKNFNYEQEVSKNNTTAVEIYAHLKDKDYSSAKIAFLKYLQLTYKCKTPTKINNSLPSFANACHKRGSLHFRPETIYENSFDNFTKQLITISHEFAHAKYFQENYEYEIFYHPFNINEGVRSLEHCHALTQHLIDENEKILCENMGKCFYWLTDTELNSKHEELNIVSDFIKNMHKYAKNNNDTDLLDICSQIKEQLQNDRNVYFSDNRYTPFINYLNDNKQNFQALYLKECEDILKTPFEKVNIDKVKTLCSLQDCHVLYDKTIFKKLKNYCSQGLKTINEENKKGQSNNIELGFMDSKLCLFNCKYQTHNQQELTNYIKNDCLPLLKKYQDIPENHWKYLYNHNDKYIITSFGVKFVGTQNDELKRYNFNSPEKQI